MFSAECLAVGRFSTRARIRVCRFSISASYGHGGSMGLDHNRLPGDACPFSTVEDVRRLCQNGQLKEALQIVDFMVQQKHRVPINTYAYLLQECIKVKALEEGKHVHAQIIRSGFKLDTSLGNILINMYIKCGSILSAHHVFNKMPGHDAFSWASILSAYAKSRQAEEVLNLFHQMLLEGVALDKIIFIIVLKACAQLSALECGRQVHAHITKSGLDSDIFVGSTLVHMYVKCKSIDYARQVFEKMPQRDVVCWTAMMAGCVQLGHNQEALALYEQMQEEDVKPNNVTLIIVLKACASVTALEQGKQIHSQIVNNSSYLNLCIGNSLIDMYVKCGSIQDAFQVFNKMNEHNVGSWNAMISAYAQQGLGKEAFLLFDQMQQQGIIPSNVTFVSVLKACSRLKDLQNGEKIHAQVLKNGCSSDAFVLCAVIGMYLNCGIMEKALFLFRNIPERNVVLWTTMITGSAQLGFGDKALGLLTEMQQEGVKPNNVTFVSILKAFSSPTSLKWGKQVHIHAVKSEIASCVLVGNALMDMYIKCGSVGDAQQVFINMSERNVISWTMMIAGFVQQRLNKEALTLFEEMLQEGINPNNVTFVSILKACASLVVLQHGRQVHALIIACGFEADVFVANTLIDMYAKCGSLEEAHQVFIKMTERSVASWNVIIAGYAYKGCTKEALALFDEMQDEGMDSDEITFLSVLKACTVLKQGKKVHAHVIRSGFQSNICVACSLIDMYSKCGCIEDAYQVFSQMHERNVVLWNAILTGYAQQGFGMETLNLFRQMRKEGTKPNEATFVSVLSACSHTGLLDEGYLCFNCISQGYGIVPTPDHCACMVDLLGRAGFLDEAEEIISKLPIQPDTIVWMALLGSCRIQSNIDLGKCAFQCIMNLDSKNDGAYVLLSNIFADAGKWHAVANIRKIWRMQR